MKCKYCGKEIKRMTALKPDGTGITYWGHAVTQRESCDTIGESCYAATPEDKEVFIGEEKCKYCEAKIYKSTPDGWRHRDTCDKSCAHGHTTTATPAEEPLTAERDALKKSVEDLTAQNNELAKRLDEEEKRADDNGAKFVVAQAQLNELRNKRAETTDTAILHERIRLQELTIKTQSENYQRVKNETVNMMHERDVERNRANQATTQLEVASAQLKLVTQQRNNAQSSLDNRKECRDLLIEANRPLPKAETFYTTKALIQRLINGFYDARVEVCQLKTAHKAAVNNRDEYRAELTKLRTDPTQTHTCKHCGKDVYFGSFSRVWSHKDTGTVWCQSFSDNKNQAEPRVPASYNPFPKLSDEARNVKINVEASIGSNWKTSLHTCKHCGTDIDGRAYDHGTAYWYHTSSGSKHCVNNTNQLAEPK